MNEYLVWFDCCVIDEPVIKHIVAENDDECWEKAYKISCGTGLSQGNFEIYKKLSEEE